MEQQVNDAYSSWNAYSVLITSRPHEGGQIVAVLLPCVDSRIEQPADNLREAANRGMRYRRLASEIGGNRIRIRESSFSTIRSAPLEAATASGVSPGRPVRLGLAPFARQGHGRLSLVLRRMVERGSAGPTRKPPTTASMSRFPAGSMKPVRRDHGRGLPWSTRDSQHNRHKRAKTEKPCAKFCSKCGVEKSF